MLEDRQAIKTWELQGNIRCNAQLSRTEFAGSGPTATFGRMHLIFPTESED
jgi:hypothetical protein